MGGVASDISGNKVSDYDSSSSTVMNNQVKHFFSGMKLNRPSADLPH
tara:strand:+ start:302 stop:442 length:141 start_codon:yes stop_codon:yes gene_type:complete